jgi:uncharacterized DUF497 family protein
LDGSFEFEWDENKAEANLRKHDVSFDLACTVFHDPQIVTVSDLEHGENEERWFSIGCASNGLTISVVYLWSQPNSATTSIRLISARRASRAEARQYEESL